MACFTQMVGDNGYRDFLFAYLLYAEVLRENTYLSRTIEVQENQKVIDSGLYGIVSTQCIHPQYCCLSMPLMLVRSFRFLFFLPSHCG